VGTDPGSLPPSPNLNIFEARALMKNVESTPLSTEPLRLLKSSNINIDKPDHLYVLATASLRRTLNSNHTKVFVYARYRAAWFASHSGRCATVARFLPLICAVEIEPCKTPCEAS